MGTKKTTHVRVDMEIKNLANFDLKAKDGTPLYTPGEIFKAGYLSLKAYNKIGRGLYGAVWKKDNKK